MSASSIPTPQCPLCGKPAEQVSGPNFSRRVKCVRCGRFDVQLDALAGIKREQMYLLSTVCRNWNGTEVLTISQQNVDALMQQAPKLGVSETLNQILELAAQRTEGIGSLSTLDIATDYPLVAARNPEEMTNLVTALMGRGF